MSVRQKAALLLSTDLREVAREVHEARDLIKAAHALLVGAGVAVPSEIPNAFERLTAAQTALEGRPPNPG